MGSDRLRIPAGEWPLNDAAGNFLPRIAGWLRGEVVGACMNDHGPADDLADSETVGQKHLKSVSVISPQWGKIPRMLGMNTATGIIKRFCFGESVAAVPRARAAAVDMKRKNTVFAGRICRRKTKDLR